jgi:hypothetical protein
MTAILLRRVVRLVFVCFGVSLVTFLLMHLSGRPGGDDSARGNRG